MADHQLHDLLLVAEAADRGGSLPETLADCPDCRSLHADLLALASAIPTAAIPARPRDYTITQAQAARLRPAGWRRALAAFGTARDTVSRPLAVGLTTLGLAGLLVATVPGALPLSGAAVGESTNGTDAAVAAPAASAVPELLAPEAAPGGGSEAAPGEFEVGAKDADGQQRTNIAGEAGGTGSPLVPPLVLVSVVMLAIGGCLLVVRRVRRGDH